MSIITIFGGLFCHADDVIGRLAERTGRPLINDTALLESAAKLGDIPVDKIERAFSAKPSVFNKFTHEKERSVAYLRLAAAQAAQQDGVVITGYVGMLIPPSIDHMVRVCIIADVKHRLEQAIREGHSEKEAARQLRRGDEDLASWIQHLFGVNDPWDASLFDIVAPLDKMSADEAVELIIKHTDEKAIRTTPHSQKTAADFLLAAEVGAAMARAGHNVDVEADGGAVTLIINKNVFMLGRLEEELRSIAAPLPGVTSVDTRVGKDFHQSDIYRRYNFEMPSRVLLVDDEREFVQTLSERLLMREMGSTVAYDGQSALDLIDEEEPEVMILDLKMPGIDGVEVLRRVKQSNPEVEVIILTGHGSEENRQLCMELGAFAYLHKPVDIEALSETLKKAYEKRRRQDTATGSAH